MTKLKSVDNPPTPPRTIPPPVAADATLTRSPAALRRASWPMLGIAAVTVLATGLWWQTEWRPVEVHGYLVATGPFVSVVNAPGYLVSRQQADIGPETPGRLVAIYVAVGQHVAAGDRLAQFDDAGARAALQSATARRDSAIAQFELAQVGLTSSEQAMERAKDTLARQQSLRTAGTISEADFSAAQDAFARVETDLAKAESGLATASADLRAADAGVAEAEVALSRTAPVAPFAGIVTGLHASLGDVLTAGTPVLSIADPDQLAIEIRLDERALSSLAEDQVARVVFRASDGEAIAGRVTTIDQRLDPDTRLARVMLTLDAVPDTWAIGQRADVTIETGVRQAITIALDALHWDDDQAFVFVANRGRADLRPIRLGDASHETVQITAGLTPGDLVIEGEGLHLWRRVQVVAP